MRYGMVIDLRHCLGCNSCTVACKMHNGEPPGVLLSRVEQRETGAFPRARMDYLPLLCMQCENPACVQVCPTGASYVRPDGIVAIDPERCMGCKYCMAACPYGARAFVESIGSYFPEFEPTAYEEAVHARHREGVVEKCDFCAARVEQGGLPACVQACPAKARVFGDLDDPDSEVSRLIAERGGKPLLPELGTSPSVYYLPA